MSVVVIGRGLIGSAAARHLAKIGVEVVLIGPDEPDDWAAHPGVFASHYDEGRITRRSEATEFWGRVSAASIDRYDEIRAESGVEFFTEAGALMAGHGPQVERVAQVRERLATGSEVLDTAGLRERFPFLHFADGDAGFHEPTGAGHISPRALVRAQGIAAERAGATVIASEVRGLARGTYGWQVILPDREIFADRVLVAAGGFANTVLPAPVPITVYARTVALYPLDEGEAARLSAMPSCIYLQPDGLGPYLLPPIRYPDGVSYVKIGGDPVDRTVEGPAIAEWFRSGGSAEVGEYLTRTIRTRIPGLSSGAPVLRPCVTTFSDRDRPIIDRMTEDLTVAVAGCGRGAKCSDELGRLAAAAVTGQPDPLLAETRL